MRMSSENRDAGRTLHKAITYLLLKAQRLAVSKTKLVSLQKAA
jgi:hypothetical protein